MVAPFAAGAPVDTVGRIVAERMSRSLGQQIVVENVAGAGGSLGVARAARAAADGYTISLGNFSSHVLVESVYPVQFDVLRDFEPVALLASNPQLIISRNDLPAHDLKGLIAWLKANPDKASASIAGVGSVSHVDAQPPSSRILAARMTLPHFSVSSATSLPNSAGAIGIGSPPRSARRPLILPVGEARVDLAVEPLDDLGRGALRARRRRTRRSPRSPARCRPGPARPAAPRSASPR